jgi:hypothetical protein
LSPAPPAGSNQDGDANDSNQNVCDARSHESPENAKAHNRTQKHRAAFVRFHSAKRESAAKKLAA